MSYLKELEGNWSEPSWWMNTALPYLKTNAIQKIFNKYSYTYFALRGVDFISVPDSDWDNLVLFDACRYDRFQELNIFDGNLKQVYSKAPQTPIFLKKNFDDRKLHDTVVVSANPHQKVQLSDNQFHRVYHVWRTHWDKELKTVHPESVTEVARKASRNHPKKRLIIHYMQPHAPFIGEWGLKNIGVHIGNKHSYNLAQKGSHEYDSVDPFTMMKEDEFKRNDIIQAYDENLNIVMKSAEKLLDNLQGKTVISADHGEMFGERAWPIPLKVYQHPPLMAKSLLEVPWMVIKDGTRKTISAENALGSDNSKDEDTVENRLQHLGYK